MIKRRIWIMQITLLVLMLSTSCTSAQQKEQDTHIQSDISPERTLIVYLSRTKNTKAVAEIIQKNVGGRLVALELENPYPGNYQANVDQVKKELETGFLPPLKTKIDSIEKYDVIFIGFPTWSMELPPPMKSFLKQYDFTGKTIVPFNTNAGYGTGNSFETVKLLCPESKILKGFSTKGGKEKDGILFVMEGEKEKQVQAEVKKWLKKIGIVK